MLRFHTQTGGATLTAQQPREQHRAHGARGARGGPRRDAVAAHELLRRGARAADRASREDRAPDAAGDRPRDRGDAHRRPARGLVLPGVAHERGRGGALAYIDRIDRMGGAVAAIEAGFYQDEIHEAAYAMQQGIESGARVVVGVNRFEDPQEHGLELQRIAEEDVARQVERVRDLRASRDRAAVDRALADVEAAARGTGNLLPADEAGLARAGDARRGLRRAADRLRRVPPRLAEQPNERVDVAAAPATSSTARQPSQAARTHRRRPTAARQPSPTSELDRERRSLGPSRCRVGSAAVDIAIIGGRATRGSAWRFASPAPGTTSRSARVRRRRAPRRPSTARELLGGDAHVDGTTNDHAAGERRGRDRHGAVRGPGRDLPHDQGARASRARSSSTARARSRRPWAGGRGTSCGRGTARRSSWPRRSSPPTFGWSPPSTRSRARPSRTSSTTWTATSSSAGATRTRRRSSAGSSTRSRTCAGSTRGSSRRPGSSSR